MQVQRWNMTLEYTQINRPIYLSARTQILFSRKDNLSRVHIFLKHQNNPNHEVLRGQHSRLK